MSRQNIFADAARIRLVAGDREEGARQRAGGHQEPDRLLASVAPSCLVVAEGIRGVHPWPDEGQRASSD